MSKYKNINSSIIYYVLTITLDVSSIGTHTHLLVLVIYCSITRLYCLQPIVLGIMMFWSFDLNFKTKINFSSTFLL